MTFDELVKMKQNELFLHLKCTYGKKATSLKGSYILVKGEAPVLLVAHLDTVHKERVQTICWSDDGVIAMSPQGIGGDDRCGVWALMEVYDSAKVKPWLLFTCDEEIGGVGANKFCSMYKSGKLPKDLRNLKLIIEIDRKGENDAVYYDCANPEFEEYITSKGFITNFGSFSDISMIAPALGVAAVNLSSGYYNAHTQHEYINLAHLANTINRVNTIIRDAAEHEFPRYEYIEAVHESLLSDWSYWGYGGKQILETLPETIRDEYEALLEFYSTDELEFLRAENGDSIILEMFRSEFGDWNEYFEIMGYDIEDDAQIC